MTALITGATGGIGSALAEELAKRGIGLILASRNVEQMEKMKRRLPVPVEVVPADLTRKEDCYALYERVKDRNVDILINNAGFGILGHFSETALETELEMLALNVEAVHILTKLFLADFRRRNRGYLLNVASSAGFLAGPGMAAYYAGKSYVLRLTEAIHEELRQEGSAVKICALCPGPVQTGFQKRAGIRGGMKGISARQAARAGLRGMFRNKAVVLPGMSTKLGYLGQKFLPEKLVLQMTYAIQSKKKG